MIALHPTPRFQAPCPSCGQLLTATDWTMPGMRALAVLRCEPDDARFLADLPTGHGLYYPCMLAEATGEVFGGGAGPWFARWLRSGWPGDPTDVPLRVERLRPVDNAVLLNCLDGVYGHALLKLLSAQHYIDSGGGADLVVLAPSWLRWLVPDGAAEVWTVDLPPSRLTACFASIARQVRERVESFGSCDLAVAFPHPAEGSFAIERFSGVTPFELDRWEQLPATITFAWREQRAWGGTRAAQLRRVRKLAARVRTALPAVNFTVAGVGPAGGLPAWINDVRQARPSDEIEEQWCELYARSHVVVGMHGSNMLLPSAHAGGVVDLLPTYKLGNIAQDLLPFASSNVDALTRYRFIPDNSAVHDLVHVVTTLLTDYPTLRLRTDPRFADHATVDQLTRDLPHWHQGRNSTHALGRQRRPWPARPLFRRT